MTGEDRLCHALSGLCTLSMVQEACQSGRMGLTANELSLLKGTGGSNPLASAAADSLSHDN